MNYPTNVQRLICSTAEFAKLYVEAQSDQEREAINDAAGRVLSRLEATTAAIARARGGS